MAKIAVAPLVGAWIEIKRKSESRLITRSLPSWERGLKYHGCLSAVNAKGKSLPSWERGLKYVSAVRLSLVDKVAPLVGAWIEIVLHSCKRCGSGWVAPLVGAWIEIHLLKCCKRRLCVAPLVGAWIEIQVGTCVAIVVIVAPLVGAWIEIPKRLLGKIPKMSLPSWERGLKYPRHAYGQQPPRRSPRGSVD